MICFSWDYCVFYTAWGGGEVGKWLGVNAFVDRREAGLDIEVFVLVDVVMEGWDND